MLTRRQRRFLFGFATPTLEGLRFTARIYSGEVFECHSAPAAIDVVGTHPGLPELIDCYRPVGVLANYYPTHEARLAEFQKRLDAAKRRAGMI